jgi:hypothetical protein
VTVGAGDGDVVPAGVGLVGDGAAGDGLVGDGVDGGAASGAAAVGSGPDGPRADELVPPSHAAARSASTPRRPTATSRTRRVGRWRRPPLAIDSILALVVT